MINIIWNTLDCFIEDWRNSPYKWETEVDIQAEIACRLRQTLGDTGKLIIQENYDYIRKGEVQQYSRVCCEPKVYYIDKQGKQGWCLPDIVVYDNANDSNKHPDTEFGKNWPIFWVCEIKYHTEDKGSSKQEKDWDIDKMDYWLRQGEAKFACSLFFKRTAIDKNIIKPTIEKNDRFRKYTILPKR